MGRKRSEYICPKCQKTGSLGMNRSRNGHYKNGLYNEYWVVYHYDSQTKKKSRCYVDNIIKEKECEIAKEHPLLYTMKGSVKYTGKFLQKRDRYVSQSLRIDSEIEKRIVQDLDETIALLTSYLEELKYCSDCKSRGEENDRTRKFEKQFHEDLKTLVQMMVYYKQHSEQYYIDCIDFVNNVPLLRAITDFYYSCEKPLLIKKKKELKEKLSEAAFGSDKHPGTITS